MVSAHSVIFSVFSLIFISSVHADTKHPVFKRFASDEFWKAPHATHPQASVYVPSGYRVVSGGAEARFSGQGQMLTRSYPLLRRGEPVGWAAGSKDHLHLDKGQVRAYAIAIYDPHNEWDIKVVKAVSRKEDEPHVIARLPHGYDLLGGGANLLYHYPGSLLVATHPIGTTGWYAAAKDHIETASSTLEAYAIGIKRKYGPSGLSIRIDTAMFGRKLHVKGELKASGSWKYVAGGATMTRGGVGSMLVKVCPSIDGHSVAAYGKDHLQVDSQYLIVYGIAVDGAKFTL